MTRKIVYFSNVVIAFVSLFTYVIGNILLSIGKGEITMAINENHMPIYKILGCGILSFPIIISVVFNLVMVLKFKFERTRKLIQYIILIIIINILPYMFLYIFLN